MKTQWIFLFLIPLAAVAVLAMSSCYQRGPMHSSSSASQGTASKTAVAGQQDVSGKLSQTSPILTRNESIGSRLESDEVEQILRLHNQARAEVGLEPLTWSSHLGAYAQEWSDHLKATGCRMQHRPGAGEFSRKEYGENLYKGTARVHGVEDAVKAWLSEKKLYEGDPIDPTNYTKVGHYTQIVWQGTERLGCAKTACEGLIIVVCNYAPLGNVIGEKPY